MGTKKQGIKAFYLMGGQFVPVRILEFRSKKEALCNTSMIANVLIKLSKLYRRNAKNEELAKKYPKVDLKKRIEILAKMEKINYEKPTKEG